LIELIIVMMICLLLSTIALTLFQRSTSSQEKITGKLTLQMEARKASDVLIACLRESSEVIRPSLGETLPFLVVKDLTNEVVLMYQEHDEESSRRFKRNLTRLVAYSSEFGRGYVPANEKILLKALRNLTFTCLSPGGVILEATVANEREEFQFLTHVGFVNLGAVE
jgi:hypothetical protein